MGLENYYFKGIVVLTEDQLRMSHKTKNDGEENALQRKLMQRKATEIFAGYQRDGRS